MSQLHQKTFTHFTARSIPDSLSDIMGHIERILSAHPECDTYISKAKWIVSELMTNAIKHSGADEIQIKVDFNESELIIEKTDSGRPLALPVHGTGNYLSWPMKDMPADVITVHEDDMHLLYGKIEENGSVAFFAETKNIDAVSFPVENLSEHFGLLIITKAADRFTYYYDDETGCNSFKCIIDISIIE